MSILSPAHNSSFLVLRSELLQQPKFLKLKAFAEKLCEGVRDCHLSTRLKAHALLPLNRAGELGGDVVDDAVDAANFVDDVVEHR